jgi:putative nucleotidyltransferase with HDIG domain
MSEKDIEILKRRIETIGGLPTLPQIAAEVLSLVNDPSSSMKDISNIIHRDPTLASKVLKIANSAFYGLRQQVGSLQLAIVVLGLKKITGLITSVSIVNIFPADSAGGAIDRTRFWEHSAAAGFLARAVAEHAGLDFDGEEFVSGLLHDIGKLAFDQYFHDDFIRAAEMVSSTGSSAAEAERRVFGAGHNEVGAWMAENWSIPDSIRTAILHHHSVASAPEQHKTLTAVVGVANHIAKLRGLTPSTGEKLCILSKLPAWAIFTRAPSKLANANADEFLGALKGEIKAAREFMGLASS